MWPLLLEPDDALIRLTFNQDIEGVFRDRTGNGFDALSVDEPDLDRIPGGEGRAMWFDGQRDVVVFGEDAIDAVAPLTEGSILVRFSYEDTLDDQNVVPLVYVGIDDAAEQDNLLIIEVGHSDVTNQKLYFTFVRDGALLLCFDPNANLDPDVVHTFAAVVGPKGNTGFLDGAELVDRHYNAGDATTRAFFGDLPAKVYDQFTLGYGKTTDGHTPDFERLTGYLDELRVYDRPLGNREARAMTAPLGP